MSSILYILITMTDIPFDNQNPEADESELKSKGAAQTASAVEDTAQAELEAMTAKWQRSVAELENFRKRSEQESALRSKFASEGFVLDILPVVDNFYRATEHVPADLEKAPWVAGIQYIQKQLLDMIAAYGVGEIPAKVGDAFTADTQEAVGTTVDSEKPEGVIAQIVQRGYRLHDKVIRPVQVIVTKREE